MVYGGGRVYHHTPALPSLSHAHSHHILHRYIYAKPLFLWLIGGAIEFSIAYSTSVLSLSQSSIEAFGSERFIATTPSPFLCEVGWGIASSRSYVGYIWCKPKGSNPSLHVHTHTCTTLNRSNLSILASIKIWDKWICKLHPRFSLPFPIEYDSEFRLHYNAKQFQVWRNKVSKSGTCITETREIISFFFKSD